MIPIQSSLISTLRLSQNLRQKVVDWKINSPMIIENSSFGNDYAIVYDCKNMQDFIPNAEEERAIRKYLNDEKTIRNEQHIYCAFIAKSFRREGRKDIF